MWRTAIVTRSSAAYGTHLLLYSWQFVWDWLSVWLECITHSDHVWWSSCKTENRYFYILYFVSDRAERNSLIVCWLTVSTDSSCSPTAWNIRFIGQCVKWELGSNQNLSFMKHVSNYTMCHDSKNVNIWFLLPINRGHFVPILTKMKHRATHLQKSSFFNVSWVIPTRQSMTPDVFILLNLWERKHVGCCWLWQ